MSQPSQIETPTEVLITELSGVRLLKHIPVEIRRHRSTMYIATIKGLEGMMESYGGSSEQALNALKSGIVRQFDLLEEYESRGREPYNHQRETVAPLREYVTRE